MLQSKHNNAILTFAHNLNEFINQMQKVSAEC